jgi:hypothetical protein
MENVLMIANVRLVLVVMVVITKILTRFVIHIPRLNMLVHGGLVAELIQGKEQKSNLDIVLETILIVMGTGVVGEIGVLGQ